MYKFIFHKIRIYRAMGATMMANPIGMTLSIVPALVCIKLVDVYGGLEIFKQLNSLLYVALLLAICFLLSGFWAYVLITPMFGAIYSVRLFIEYGPKTLLVVQKWMNGEGGDELDIEAEARRLGELD